MPRTILLGLDGSEYSEAAVDLGIRWTKQFSSLLIGLSVVDVPNIYGTKERSEGHVKDVFDGLVDDARRRVEGLLETFAIRCAEAQVPYKLLEDVGEPEEYILREAERYDLIMLGQETHFHFQTQSRPCKTLEHVLRMAPRPVVAVPKTPTEGHGVLVAYDGSLQSARTLQAFVALGLSALGEVHVLNVHPDSAVEAAKVADRAIEFLGFHDIQAVACRITSQEPPGKVILREAVDRGVGLIVMGAFGEPRLKEFLLGSVTCTALEQSTLPVLLYH